MNNELEDLMLEYLLRKKLNQNVTQKQHFKAKSAPTAPTGKIHRRRLPRHTWSRADYEQVATLFQQGYTNSQIAKSMSLRTMQIDGAIEGMKGKNVKSAAPRLLVGQ